MNDFWILITAFIIAVNCGLLGVFLMLQKKAMIGDAISHSVLPGIVIAYLISGSRASFPMLIGAAAVGMLTTVLIEFLSKKARLQNEASIGITFTWMFAIGVILIAFFTQSGIDLDQECVLYGDIAYINLDKIIVDGNLYIGPRVFWNQVPIFLVVSAIIAIGFKGWKVITFNPDFASSLGFKVSHWNYLLMALVSIVTVMSFEAVGAILVVGLLVIPPASAYLMTSKMKLTLALTFVFDAIGVVFGYYLAKSLNTSIAGTIITVMGGIFFLIVLYQYLFQKKFRFSSGKKSPLSTKLYS